MCGEAITWLVPHALSQVLPADVDYRVMLTFLEFYEVRSSSSCPSSARCDVRADLSCAHRHFWAL